MAALDRLRESFLNRATEAFGKGVVIDTIGGGDTYAAGFLAEYSRSRDPIAAGRYATAASSLVCEVAGPLKEAQPEKVQEKISIAKQVLQPEPVDLTVAIEK